MNKNLKNIDLSVSNLPKEYTIDDPQLYIDKFRLDKDKRKLDVNDVRAAVNKVKESRTEEKECCLSCVKCGPVCPTNNEVEQAIDDHFNNITEEQLDNNLKAAGWDGKRIPICPVCGENVEIKVKKELKTADYAHHHVEVITELLVICYTCGAVFESFKSE